MGYLYGLLSWGSPVGVGLFLVLLALAFYIVSEASKNFPKQKKK